MYFNIYFREQYLKGKRERRRELEQSVAALDPFCLVQRRIRRLPSSELRPSCNLSGIFLEALSV